MLISTTTTLLLKANILFFLSYIVLMECSQVIDEKGQKGIHITDYCPKIGICAEGTHVMCLHYNPIRVMGPSCSNVVNVSITPYYAQMILDIMNRIRSKITKGLIKGSKGIQLPRGYGIFRLNWDEELATFAQVWANQCKMTSDLCRASKKFSDVGQTLGMSRFTIEGWRPINSPQYSNSTTATPEKVKYAILSVMKAWYSMKDEITPNVITQTDVRPKRMLQNQFLNLIYGNVTHIGCGISAYREYAFHSNNAPLNYNSVQIVCNYSSRFQRGAPIYATDPPTRTGYTVKCGCPLGYDEDEDCLCYESGRQLPFSCKNDSRCQPAVVVLPIFTVEDAPKQLRGLGNNPTLLMNTNEVLDRFDLLKGQPPKSVRSLPKEFRRNGHNSDVPWQMYSADVKSRYFDINRGSRKVHCQSEIPYHGHNNRQSRRSKQSIFSIAPIFELPIRKNNPITYHSIKNYKKDVAPRKDFSEVKKLVSEYLDKKKSATEYITYGPNELNSFNGHEKSEIAGKNFYMRNKNNEINFNGTKNINTPITPFNLDYKNFVNKDVNRQLMTLLDRLEQEIKEKELNTKEKGIFDNKIRKIYGTLVGKPDFDGKYNLPTIFQKNNQTNNIDRDIIKPDHKDIYGNEYFESRRPYDNYKEIKLDESFNEGFNKTFNKGNYNTDETRQPTFDFNNAKINMRNMYDIRKFDRNISRDNLKDLNGDEDLIDFDRRRYYDNKLENLRRKIQTMKVNRYQNKVREDRKLRPVRPTKSVDEQATQLKPKEDLNTFYIADRARSLHGF